MASPEIVVLPPMDSTLGALLIGGYCSAALYGLISHQAYRYYRMYPHDGPSLKRTVAAFWCIETFHVILIIHLCYTYMVTNYFNPEALGYGTWSLRVSITISGVIIFLAQSFFARRLYILGGKKLSLYIFTLILAALGTFLAIGVTIASYLSVTIERFEKYQWIMSIGLGTALLTNIIITARLCWILHTSRTGFKKTDTLIDTLMAYTVNTGLITSLVTLADLVSVLTMKGNFIFIGLFFIINKLYTNAFLAILNSRHGSAHSYAQGSFEIRSTFDPQHAQAIHALHHRTPYQFNAESSQDATNETPSERVFDIGKRQSTSSGAGN